MKKIKTVDTEEYVTERINAWCRNQGKSYLTDEADFVYLNQRYIRHIDRAKIMAHLVAFSTLISLSVWIAQTDQLNSESILATTVMTSVVWIITRVCLADAGKNIELFDSLRQLNREWNRLEELHSVAKDNSDHLRLLGNMIAEAERRQDPSAKVKLMKAFRWDHKVLFNFGIAEEDWGKYIPNPNPNTIVTMDVDWTKVGN
jgi:hypothetical protein